MPVLDTFFIEFRTNQKQAEAEILKLNKAINDIAEKGKKISEDELKQLKELSEQREKLKQQLKDQKDALDDLGDSLTNIFTKGVSAFSAYGIFRGIKQGVSDVTNFNSALQITASRTNQSVEQLRRLDAFFEAGGSKRGNFIQLYNSAFEQQASAGLGTPAPEALIRRIRSAVLSAATPQAKELVYQRFGLPFDEATKARIEAPQSEFEEGLKDAAENARLYGKQAKEAREFEAQYAQTQQALQTLYTQLATDILPAFKEGLKGVTKVLNFLTNIPGGSELGAGAALGGSFYFGGKFLKWGSNAIKALLSGGGAAAGDGAAAGLLSRFGAVGALASAPWVGSWAGEKIADYIKSMRGGNPTLTQGSFNGSISKQSYDFWISKGYSPEQAAILVGNQIGEGWTGTGSIGDHGTAFGIAQWRGKRIDDILKNTGIDVRKAGLTDQLAAQDWEMRTRYGITPDTLPNNRILGTDYLVRNYEFSANQALDAARRAGYAADIANQYIGTAGGTTVPGGGGIGGGDKTISLRIDKVDVNTQATDAKGIAQDFNAAMQSHLRDAFSNFDDGVKG